MYVLLRLYSFNPYLNQSLRFTRTLSRAQFRKLSRLSYSTPTLVKTMGKPEEALLGTEVINQRNPWKKQNLALTIALFTTATGILLVMACLAVHSCSGADDTTPTNFVLTPDAEHWQKVGEENANRDLSLFDTIAANLASGSGDHAQLSEQLVLFQNQIREVGDNNRQLIPQIIDVITRINGFLEADSPSVFSKMGLKALVWYVDGKRDNKSYYLLDGAQLWSALRIKILKKYLSGEATSKLIQELGGMQKETADLRDELDAMAQIFVKGIKRIHVLSADIGANLVELKQIAKNLLDVSVQKDVFLGHTKDLEANVDNLVKEWK